MLKRIISFTAIFCLVSALVAPTPVSFAAASSIISAPAGIVIDGVSGRTIFSKSPHVKRPQASTTKVMTAMVVLDRASLNDVVTISSKATDVQPTKLYLKAGEKYYVKDLIYAILMKSANDAAEALAIHIAGSVPAFCELMNRRARALGAENTAFKTPNGLPAKGQYSTAYDLALIMQEAERYPFIVKALTLKDVTIKSLGGRSISFKSHNKMLWSEKYDVIGKTGYTRSSSYCFVGRVNGQDKDVYLSVLGSQSRDKFWSDVRKLCGFPNQKYSNAVRVNKKLWSREETLEIQRLLNASNYYVGKVDGIFGSRTVKAVEAFQRDHNLSVDGIVGKKTMSVLRNSR